MKRPSCILPPDHFASLGPAGSLGSPNWLRAARASPAASIRTDSVKSYTMPGRSPPRKAPPPPTQQEWMDLTSTDIAKDSDVIDITTTSGQRTSQREANHLPRQPKLSTPSLEINSFSIRPRKESNNSLSRIAPPPLNLGKVHEENFPKPAKTACEPDSPIDKALARRSNETAISRASTITAIAAGTAAKAARRTRRASMIQAALPDIPSSSLLTPWTTSVDEHLPSLEYVTKSTLPFQAEQTVGMDIDLAISLPSGAVGQAGSPTFNAITEYEQDDSSSTKSVNRLRELMLDPAKIAPHPRTTSMSVDLGIAYKKPSNTPDAPSPSLHLFSILLDHAKMTLSQADIHKMLDSARVHLCRKDLHLQSDGLDQLGMRIQSEARSYTQEQTRYEGEKEQRSRCVLRHVDHLEQMNTPEASRHLQAAVAAIGRADKLATACHERQERLHQLNVLQLEHLLATRQIELEQLQQKLHESRAEQAALSRRLDALAQLGSSLLSPTRIEELGNLAKAATPLLVVSPQTDTIFASLNTLPSVTDDPFLCPTAAGSNAPSDLSDYSSQPSPKQDSPRHSKRTTLYRASLPKSKARYSRLKAARRSLGAMAASPAKLFQNAPSLPTSEFLLPGALSRRPSKESIATATSSFSDASSSKSTHKTVRSRRSLSDLLTGSPLSSFPIADSNSDTIEPLFLDDCDLLRADSVIRIIQ
ncbi:uncharacterized protein L969DRAFT_51720 [Mixia osmundae IAM 14324]|uniref:Uncharacterized protein n=1 Tax=Mixia osmundae (strain CBS 9802 / IAM 14324 / JCM 22182 / KY 12970) TaxID=764103 RepID=G7DWP5_MIXOS|nr:uncharacterized protein L969DRAFT_51720 [Mixia osmundae IAM 14324]KEI38037.1 hypothetical protein L969DRAFT_51720 [Mixia osmundae IAM 14324]GAA95157.1 hypothetical protein E5Q_01812 [Mixia osmundae IAM 14324]